jgi:hypothetical protein
MPALTTYTLGEFGESSSRGRDVCDAEAEAALEAATVDAEREIGRRRSVYAGDLGRGYQVGNGLDPRYKLILLSRY